MSNRPESKIYGGLPTEGSGLTRSVTARCGCPGGSVVPPLKVDSPPVAMAPSPGRLLQRRQGDRGAVRS